MAVDALTQLIESQRVSQAKGAVLGGGRGVVWRCTTITARGQMGSGGAGVGGDVGEAGSLPASPSRLVCASELVRRIPIYYWYIGLV